MTNAVTIFADAPLEALIGELPARVALLVAEGSPRQIKDAADYLRTQLRRAGLAFEVRNAAAEAWLELEAGCGLRLAGKLRVGAPSKTVRAADSFRLKDFGITRNLSSRMQAIAAIPLRDRAQYYKDAREGGWEISWGGETGLKAHAAGDPDERTGSQYLITPPELLMAWRDEFNGGEPFFDPCPYPRPAGFDGLAASWGPANYVNPLFAKDDDGNGPTAWVRKGIAEHNLGKLVLLVIPATPQATNLLLAAGAELRPLDRVKWLEATTGEPMPSPGNVTLFILRPHGNSSQIISPIYPANDLSSIRPWENNRSPLAPRTIRPMNDDIHTDMALPKRLVKHFQPSGLCLDCCRGVQKDSAFYDSLPQLKEWCEVKLGRDFLAWTKRVSWIFTNPPWSSKVYRAISQHCFEVADNVVLLTRLHNAIGTYARHHDWLDRGHGLKEVVIVKWEDAGFPLEGFVLGAFHWRLGHNSGTTWTYWD